MMNDNSMPGLTPIWLIGLALALGVGIVTLIPISIAGKDALTPGSWIGFAGSVLGGSLTVVGFFVAARNVNRQLRINLISREESRIEEQLPGLHELRDRLRGVGAAVADAKTLLGALHRFRHWSEGADINTQIGQQIRAGELRNENWLITEESLAKLMPLVEPVLQRRTLIIFQLLRQILRQNGATVEITNQDMYDYARTELTHLYNEIDNKIRVYDLRLVTFRGELERYFSG